MKYDFYKKCYEKNAAFVEKRPALKKALPLFDKGLTALFFLAYIGLCLYALVKNVSGVELMKILFPPLLCLLVVTVLRFTIDKPRPYMAEGAGITPLITKKKGDNQSFPSRHIASATVIATTFLPFFPAISITFYCFALLLTYVRFSLGLHYISDLAAGGVLGVVLGLVVYIL